MATPTTTMMTISSMVAAVISSAIDAIINLKTLLWPKIWLCRKPIQTHCAFLFDSFNFISSVASDIWFYRNVLVWVWRRARESHFIGIVCKMILVRIQSVSSGTLDFIIVPHSIATLPIFFLLLSFFFSKFLSRFVYASTAVCMNATKSSPLSHFLSLVLAILMFKMFLRARKKRVKIPNSRQKWMCIWLWWLKPQISIPYYNR